MLNVYGVYHERMTSLARQLAVLAADATDVEGFELRRIAKELKMMFKPSKAETETPRVKRAYTKRAKPATKRSAKKEEN